MEILRISALGKGVGFIYFHFFFLIYSQAMVFSHTEKNFLGKKKKKKLLTMLAGQNSKYLFFHAFYNA